MRRGPRLACVCAGVLALASSAAGQDVAEPNEGSEDAPVATTSAEDEASAPEVPAEIQAEARGRFMLGESLYEQGRFEEAAAEFAMAYEISSRPELLYNLYLAHRDAGDVANAADALKQYLERLPDVPNRALLTGRLTILRERLAADNAQRQAIEDADARARAAEAATTMHSPNRAGPVIFFAAGGATLLAAGALALNVRSIGSDLDAGCFGGLCPPQLHGAIEQQDRRALSVDVLLGVGVALVAAGGLFWALQKSETREIALACGATGCSVRGAF